MSTYIIVIVLCELISHWFSNERISLVVYGTVIGYYGTFISTVVREIRKSYFRELVGGSG